MARALQAVQAGVPLTQIPYDLVLTLSGQIGNQALLGWMAQRAGRVQTVSLMPPVHPVQTQPFSVHADVPEVLTPPEWTQMPALGTAPGAVPRLSVQGGGLFAADGMSAAADGFA